MDHRRSDGLDRRGFLTATGVGGALALADTSSGLRAADPDASQVVAGKDNRLVVHEREIAVLETPPALLHDQVTPLEVLFVRNNQEIPGSKTLRAPRPSAWKIELAGLIQPKRISIALEELEEMEQVQREMVLQCSGNGRSLFAKTVAAKGTQWTRGGMGNIRVSGVPLAKLLKKLKVQIDPRARFLKAEGLDSPPEGKEDFEHSLPLGGALERSIIALSFNGHSIPAVHGGPVRLMTPGYFGTMQIKWLSRLRFEPRESENYNHIPRYRTPRKPLKPGAPIQYSLSNSKPNWRMKVKSVVLSPSPGETVAAGKRIKVRGVAFNDGSAAIDAVLISTDQGRSWRRTELKTPDSPFAWSRWTSEVTLPAGKHEIWTRAVDAWGRSQPLDGSIAWNPRGYEWNGVERIQVAAD